MMLKVATLLGLPFLVTACAASDPRERLREDCYVAKGPTEFQLLRFWDDGTFNMYLRTHLSIEQRQSGTWRIDPSGDLELLGGWRRKLVHEPFTVSVYPGASGPGADEIQRELTAFLRSHPEQVDFDAGAITALANRNGESEFGAWTQIPIAIRGTRVTRGQIDGLISALRTFPGEIRPDVVHVSRVPCGSKLFLHWRDGGPGWVEDSLDEMKKAVSNDDPLPSFNAVFLRVPLEQFKEILRGGP